MANIDIRRFVNVDILYHSTSTASSIRDIVVLLSTENDTDAIYTNLNNFKTTSKLDDDSLTAQYATIYFNHGGNKLRVIYNVDADNLESIIAELPNEQIVVAYTGEYDDIKKVAQNRESQGIYGIEQKILLGRINTVDDDDITNFAVKYSNVVGAEMTIAAYLCSIDIYGINTVNDYAFTKENISEEDIDTDTYDEIMTANMNVDIYLANTIMNVGGNLKNGLDLVNQYTLIILHQTVTDVLLNLLTTKLKGQTGVAAIQTAITQELTKYVTNGYLTTDKIWTDPSVYIEYNGESYEVIKQNTALLLGYKVAVLPISSLTEEDIENHKTPYIYIILATSYGIRSITINGEVI